MPSPFMPGSVIAQKYGVERVLGRGGMGVVLAARHVDLDEQVAIKVLVGSARKESDARRFLREARTAAKVKNEHVCRVFDVGRLETGEPFLVMEYLDGLDLGAKIAREGAQRVHLATSWIIEICDALAEAHDLGIVHRDLKPANVFLARRKDGTYTTKLLDFGVSTMASASTTQPGQMMGTALYMSPEQLQQGRDVDARSDIWSLGVTLYELLAGRPPFEAGSLVELARKIRSEAPVSLATLVPEVPVALLAVIDGCLAKDPADRYPRAAALASALAPFATTEARALATRMGRCVVRASDPFLAIDSGEIEEPTFPNSSDAPPVSAREPVSGRETETSPLSRREAAGPSPFVHTMRSHDPLAPADGSGRASLEPVTGPAPAPRARGRVVVALAAAVALTASVLLAYAHGVRSATNAAQETARIGPPGAVDDLPPREDAPALPRGARR